MEIEFFVMPGEAQDWYRRWIQECRDWYTGLGLDEKRLRVRAHDPDELSHYSDATSDIEYLFPWGWGEIQGVASRTDYDLQAHSKASGHELSYFDDESGKHVVPYVVEPAAGVDRAVLAFLVDAYTEEEAPTAAGKVERRVVLKLHPTLAPVKVAVLPLSRNERLVPLARKVYDDVRRSDAAPRPGAVRRRAEHRPALQAPGRDRHAAVRYRRLRLARRQCGDDPRARLDGSGARANRPLGQGAGDSPGPCRYCRAIRCLARAVGLGEGKGS